MAAIDFKPQGIAIGLIHLRWVQTEMGSAGASISAVASATGIVKVIDQLTIDNAGKFWKWNGAMHD